MSWNCQKTTTPESFFSVTLAFLFIMYDPQSVGAFILTERSEWECKGSSYFVVVIAEMWLGIWQRGGVVFIMYTVITHCNYWRLSVNMKYQSSICRPSFDKAVLSQSLPQKKQCS